MKKYTLFAFRYTFLIFYFFLGFTDLQAQFITVTNGGNHETGSLRDALRNANNRDLITFDPSVTTVTLTASITNTDISNNFITINGDLGNGNQVRIIGSHSTAGEDALFVLGDRNISFQSVTFEKTNGEATLWFKEGASGKYEINNCVFQDNTSLTYAPIYTEAGSGGAMNLKVKNTIFRSNTSSISGVIYADVGLSTFTNCLVYDNSSIQYLFFARKGNLDIYTSTITKNNTLSVSTLRTEDDARTINVRNSIIWNNGGTPTYTQSTAGSADIQYSLIEEGSCPSDATCDANVIYDTDPLFIDPTTDKYQPQGKSPVLNVGNNANNSEKTDIRGSIRIANNTIDLGAYERLVLDIITVSPYQNAIHVSQDADIYVESSTAFASASLNFTSIRISGNQTGFYTAGSFTTVVTNPHFLTIDLDHDFKAGEEITVGFTTGLRGATGGKFTSAWQYQFTVKVPRLTSVNFVPFSSVSTGTQLTQSAYAFDADRDGDLDIALAHYNGGTGDKVGILLNDGKGKYNYSSFSAGTGVHSVHAFDADANGTMDVIAVNNNTTNNEIHILSNNGSGSFLVSPFSDGLDAPYDAEPIDIDGDGDMDLVVINNNNHTVSIVKNDGEANYKYRLSASTSAFPVAVTVFDWDKDGDMDIAIPNRTGNSVSVLESDGIETFTDISGSPYSTEIQPRDVQALDADGDGDMDLVVINEFSNTISYLENNGSGYVGAVHYNVGTDPYEISVADMDGDGDLDAIVPNKGSGTVSFLENNGSGSFTIHTVITGLDNPTSAIPVDVSGDGDLDLVITETGSTKQMVVYESVIPINVVSITPTHKALHVPETADIFVEFTTALHVDHLNFTSIQVTGTRSGAFSGTMTLSNGDPKFMTIDVTNGFKAGEFVSVTFTTVAKGARGEGFISSYTSFFTVQFLTGTVYVDKDASGNNDGSSWTHAFTDINDALRFSTSGAKIWVAEGTYRPSADIYGNYTPSDKQTKTFRLRYGIKIYGGFKGNETAFNQRVLGAYETILSGDLGIDDEFDDNTILATSSSFTSKKYNTKNVYHVLFATANISNVELNGFTIKGGYASGSGIHDEGAGLYASDAFLTISNCIFKQNIASQYGGGVHAADANLSFNSVHFIQNHSSDYGGGLLAENSTIRLKKGFFQYNYADDYSGGAHFSGGTFTSVRIDNTLFKQNYVESENGGGVSLIGAGVKAIFVNTVFDGNRTNGTSGYGYGGGLYAKNSANLFVLNSTLVDNRALGGDQKGGGIATNNAFLTVRNSIFYKNVAGNGNKSIYVSGGGSDVDYSLLQETNATLGGKNLLVENPIFTDITNSYILAKCSPARNVGDNSSIVSDILDLDNNGNTSENIPIDFLTGSRVVGGIVDMGALEIQSAPITKTVYVKWDAPISGANDGTSWNDAYTDFTTALLVSCGADEIWVAKGTYTPSADFLGDYFPSDKRTKTFRLKDGIKIYGGFAGDENNLSERDIRANRTILSGDIGIANDNSDNTYHVVFATADVNDVRLDGFTITNGNANAGGTNQSRGGGILMDKAGATVMNCFISGNNASAQGGGAMIKGGGKTNTFINTKFAFNTASNGSSAGAGGALRNEGGKVELINSIFTQNNAYLRAGAVINRGAVSSFMTITNCSFYGNTVTSSGQGGAVANYVIGAELAVHNSIFAQNTVNGSTDNFHASMASNFTTITHSLFDRAFPSNSTISHSIQNEDPLFTNAPNDDFSLLGCSPAIDKGNNTFMTISKDFLTANRIFNSTVDIGAIEYQTLNTPKRVYVDKTASGANDGTSWENAYLNFQSALKYTCSGDEIWVAKGAYYPTSGTDRSISFKLKDGVKIYGGFAGGEDNLNKRDFRTNETVLSGDIATTSSSITLASFPAFFTVTFPNEYSNNSYHVIVAEGVGNTTLLDGFIVAHGNTSGSSTTEGGGLRNINSSLVVKNTIFRFNQSSSYGGGVYNLVSSGSHSPQFINCQFTYNKASNSAGAMYNEARNTASFITTTLVNSVIAENYADNSGGGLSTRNGSNGKTFLTVINSTFFNNNTDGTSRGGGAMEIGNTGSGSTHAFIRNTILSENDAANGSGSAIYIDMTGNVDISHSLYEPSRIHKHSSATLIADATTNKTGNPKFTTVTATGLSLQPSSPALNTGNNTVVTESTDLVGTVRILDGTIDMGAYESASAEIDLKQNTTFISVNDTFDLGVSDVGNSITKTFTIINTGISDLNFSGDLQISLTTEFKTSGSLSGSLVPNASTTFNITFTPTSTGQKETFLTIFSDDGDESVYTFRVVGETPFPGNYLSFDGNDDRIQSINTVGISGTTPRSLEIWTRFNSTDTSPMDIVNWGDPTSDNAFGLRVVNQQLYFYEGNTRSTNTNFQPHLNQWSHFALTYDGTTVKIYANGVPIFTQNVSSSVTDTPLNIGNPLDGEVDEVRVWNKALSQSEIQAKMNQRLDPKVEPNLMLYYTFDQGTPNGDNTNIAQIIDQTSNQNHGTLQFFAKTGNTSNWVGHPKLQVTNASGQTLSSTQQVDLGNVAGGNSIIYPITLNNVGKNGDLKISDIQITGSAAFTTTSPSTIPSIAPLSSQSFNLIFNTAQEGTFFVTISFRNNDLFSGQFFLTVQGTIATTPELTLLYENQKLNSESTLSYGDTIVGASKVKEFYIKNQGYGDLILSNPHGSAVQIEGINRNDFVITKYPNNTTISAQNKIRFKVAFSPKATGKRRARLAIYSNMKDSPFIINLVGEGICSEITEVRGSLSSGCQVANGQVTFQLTNFVTTALYNIDIDKDGKIEYPNVAVNEKGELTIGGLADGFSIKDVQISQVFSECIMIRNNINLFLTTPTIQHTDVQVTTNITEISPKYPVKFTLENMKDSLYYQLYNAQTNELLKDSLSIENPSVTIDSLNVDFTFYLKAVHKHTACDILIQKSNFPKVEVYASIRPDQRRILQEFYNSTGGSQEWLTKWDFSLSEISDLEGVEVFAGNVLRIDVTGFGLVDEIPLSILDLPKLEELNVSENNLSFGSLENIVNRGIEFIYLDQSEIGLLEDIQVNEGDTLRLEVKTAGNQNTYQWFREGVPIEGASQAVYFVSAAQLTDTGEYYVEIYNKEADEEIMERRPIRVTVFPKIGKIDISPLEIFFEELEGDFWKVPWDFDNLSLYRQHGLEIVAEGEQIYVLSINMPNNNLVGEIPDIFEDEMFSRLRFVNLSGNKLTGTIPISMTDLETIKYLDLSDNLYSGQIPASIGQMINLKALFLSHNNFSSLPNAVFQNLTKLETLFLNNNRLKVLPDAIGQLNHLRTLHLSHNFLTTLPTSFENLTELHYLNLSHNRLITMPDYVTTFTQLEEFHIVNNFLYQLPSGLMDLPLKRFTLFNNALDHADLEPIIQYFMSGRTEEDIEIFYAPQAKIGNEQEHFLATGTNFILSIETPGEANNYQWYKNGNPINTPEGRQKSIVLRNLSKADAGQYTVLVSNTINTELVLRSYVYQISVGCGKQIEATIVADALREVCEGENANVLLRAENTEDYQINWLRDGVKIVGAITPNWNAKEAGTYSLALVDENGCTTNSVNEITIIENPLPRGRIVNQNDTLRLESYDSISNYQWYFNGLPIPEANTATCIVRKIGYYQVELTSMKGCRGLSMPLNVQVSALESDKPTTKIKVYPNPAQAQLHAQIPTKYRHQSASIEILDTEGRLISGKTEILGSEVKINLVGLAKGHYFLKISTDTQILIRKFIKEN